MGKHYYVGGCINEGGGGEGEHPISFIEMIFCKLISSTGNWPNFCTHKLVFRGLKMNKCDQKYLGIKSRVKLKIKFVTNLHN